jgi:hypothetical protein
MFWSGRRCFGVAIDVLKRLYMFLEWLCMLWSDHRCFGVAVYVSEWL